MQNRHEQDLIIGRESDQHVVQWLRFPSLAERAEREPEFAGMSEWAYQVLYACHLAAAVAKLQELFIDHQPSISQQKLLLARVPRGGLFATEILEKLLEEHHPHMVDFDRAQIRHVRAVKKAQQEDAYLEAIWGLLPADIRLEVASTVPETELHLVLPEDIADSGNTLLYLTDSFARHAAEAGHSSVAVSVLVPTASEQSVSPEAGLVTRAAQLSQRLSKEFGTPFEIKLKVFTLHLEDDMEYLHELRQDKHDHGTTHEAVRIGQRAVFEALRHQVWKIYNEQQGADGRLDLRTISQALIQKLALV